jgi:hypothetical protein
MLFGEACRHLSARATRSFQGITIATLGLVHARVVAAAAERMPFADLTHELVHAVVALGVGPRAAALAMPAAVRLPGPLPAATAPAVAPAMPATVSLATAIVLGQCGVPGEPKLAMIDGEAGRHRDQGQGRAACQKQADCGGAISGC